MQSQKSCVMLGEFRNHSLSWFGLEFRELVGHTSFLYHQELKSIPFRFVSLYRARTERSEPSHVLWTVYSVPTGWCTCPHLETHPVLVKGKFSRFYYQRRIASVQSLLNSMEHSIWSILETKACAKTHTNIESLKGSLRREWAKIPLETLRAAVEAFPR